MIQFIEKNEQGLSVDECAHLSACVAALNFSPVSQVLVELLKKFPDLPSEVLSGYLRARFQKLLNFGAIEFFVLDEGESQDLSRTEALAELENPNCWQLNGRYLAPQKVSSTTYFECIYANLSSYSLKNRADDPIN